MNTQWIDYLTGIGLTSDQRNFGALSVELSVEQSVELSAARDGSTVSPLLDFGLIRASGTDAAAFLHNLLSNDVLAVTATTARFAGMCTPKGRLIATMLISKDGDDILLMLPRDLLAGILKKLSMYVLRSKVKLTDASAEFALIGLSKPNSSTGVSEASAPFSVSAVADGYAIRLDSTRWVLFLPPISAIEKWAELSTQAEIVGTEAWQWLEIQAGQPRVVAATQEAFVPQMLNMELPEVAGVSFTKGCYPGQEIVARTQYLGKIKRRMFLAHLQTADEFGAGTPVFSSLTGEQQCGTVVSCARAPDGGFDALICVQSTAAEGGELNLGAPDGPRPVMLQMPYLVEIAASVGA